MEHILLTVTVQLTLIILAARLFASIFKRLGQPGVCGEMAAGLVLGPSLFGRFFPSLFHHVFDASVAQTLTVLSQIGLILLLFLIGMEFEFSHLRHHGRRAASISLAGMLIPFTCGIFLAQMVQPFVAGNISRTGFTLFTATAVSITALPTLGRILVEFGLHGTPIGVTAITAAAVDDAAGWTILATISAMVRSNFSPWLTLRILAETLAFCAFLRFIVRPAMKRWTARVLKREGLELSFTTLTIVLSMVFGAAIVTNLIGVFSIFGAFMMGAVLFDQDDFRRAVALRLRDFTYVFFVPVFFVYTGLRTDIGSMSSALLWKLCALLIVIAIAAKAGGSALSARWSGLSWQDSAAIGFLMNTRGLMELVVLNVGYDLGVIPKSMFFMLTLMAVTTTYMTAPVLRHLLNLRDLKFGIEEKQLGVTSVKPASETQRSGTAS